VSLPAGVRRAFRFPLSRRTLERELAEELTFHLETAASRLMDDGWPPDAAWAEARRRFGDLDRVHRECRRIDRERERRMRLMERLSDWITDLRLAARSLARTPAVALLAVLTLGLGMGATAALYSVLHAVLLEPLPIPEPERVMLVWEGDGDDTGSVSAGNFDEWRRFGGSFTHLAAAHGASFNLASEELPERLEGTLVTAGFFAALGAAPLQGRTFTEADDRPGAAPVVVLSQGLWQRRFAADPAVVGSGLRIDGETHTVIGVMPESFDRVDLGDDLWVPMAFTAERLADHDEHAHWVVGRLAPGVTPRQAQQDLRALTARLQEESFDEQRNTQPLVVPFADFLIQGHRLRLVVLFAAVGLVLLIGCVNVSNLLLARGAARRREMAVRTALGARRGRLVRQLLTESLVLSLAGAVLGVALALVGVPALVALAPSGVPRLEQAAVNGPVLAFVLGLAALTCVVAGLAPALRASRSRPAEALQSGGRAAGAVSRDRLRGVLVAAQLALALVLTVAAVLLVRSGIEVARVDPGFRVDGLLTARLTLPESAYGEADQVRAALDRLREEAAALPGVSGVAVSNTVPLGGGGGGNGLWTEDRALDNPSYGEFRLVSTGYLRVLGVPLHRGRTFDERDGRAAPRVMLINEALAKELFPDGDAVGRRVGCCVEGDAPDFWKTVVGVVGDVHGRGLDADPRSEFYLPIGQEPPEAWRWLRRTVVLSLRTGVGTDPATLTTPLRRAVQRVDPDLPLYDVATLSERLAGSRASARFNTLLLILLAGLGLLLAAVGLYGTVAHLVEQRRHEIGVRMALGASARHVVGKAVTHMLPALAAGVVLGLGGALAAGRLLESFLFGVGASDPAALGAAVVGLVAVALAACLLPARRAARVDPVRTLNEG